MSFKLKDKYDNGPKSFGLSARTSFVDQGDKTLPGPGTHQNFRINKNNSPEWGTGKDTERNTFLDKFHFQYPPSNKYDPKIQRTHPQFPNYSIPQTTQQHAQKHKDENNSLLYKPVYFVGKKASPKFSFGYFQQINYSTPVPAPNQYQKQTQRSFFNKTQRSFTSSQRPQPYGQEGRFPGSTAYRVQNYKPPSIGYTIGKGSRPQVVMGPDAPGTFYQIMGNMNKINTSKTMAPNYPSEQKKKNDFPSPNQYTPIYLTSKRRIINFSSNRTPLENQAIIKYPSPQKYNTQSDFYKKKSLSFTKDPRGKTFYLESPGPGQHYIAAQLSTKAGVMGRKIQPKISFVTPGADLYVPKDYITKLSSPRIVCYSSHRVDFSKSLTGQKVGPGSYKIDKQARLELGKISKSLKFAKQSNKNPGPGSYEIQSGIGKLPQYYSGLKKVTQEGFSTFTLQKWQKQKKNRQNQQNEKKKKEQQQLQKNSNQETI